MTDRLIDFGRCGYLRLNLQTETIDSGRLDPTLPGLQVETQAAGKKTARLGSVNGNAFVRDQLQHAFGRSPADVEAQIAVNIIKIIYTIEPQAISIYFRGSLGKKCFQPSENWDMVAACLPAARFQNFSEQPSLNFDMEYQLTCLRIVPVDPLRAGFAFSIFGTLQQQPIFRCLQSSVLVSTTVISNHGWVPGWPIEEVSCKISW